MSRPINDIAQDLNASGLNQHQLSLLVELLAAKTEDTGATPRSKRLPITPLLDNWRPNEGHFEWARRHGKCTLWVDGIAEDMRNWAASRGERRASWDGTFSTFMKRALEPRPVQHKLFNGQVNGRIGGGYA